MTGGSILYSPTPRKRRVGGKTRKSQRKSSENDDVDGATAKIRDDSCQDSLSSKLGSTVNMEESESDSDTSFCEAISTISAITEAPTHLEMESPKPDVDTERDEPSDDSPKKREKAKKKKKKKKGKEKEKEKSFKKKKKKKKDNEKSPKTKKKRSKSGKSPKTKSPRVKLDQSERSTAVGTKDQNTKASSTHLRDSDSDEDSWGGTGSFHGTHRVVPLIRQQDEEDVPGGPPLWGDTDDEKSFGDIWEEDQSWNGWDETDVQSEYIEETICDDVSNDGFSYYTINSNEDLGFPEEEGQFGFEDDVEDEEYDDASVSEESPATPVSRALSPDSRRVTFNDCDEVHNTLHICDFTNKEIRRSWYQQKDYEETIQGVKEVASSSETPRDTQTRRRSRRSLLSKAAETRGLEAWTPSGVQRFRYVKEAAFRAVWDEQQKQLERSDFDDDDVTIDENSETLRQCYQRVSTKSQLEAEERAKKDEEIAAKLLPKRKKGLGRRGSWEKSLGSSKRSLLENHLSQDLSDNPASPRSLSSCLRKPEGPIEDEEKMSKSDHGSLRGLFGEPLRGLTRQRSDRSLTSVMSEGKGLFKQASDRHLFRGKRPERGLSRQSSDRSLPVAFNKKPSSFHKKPERGLFKQISDRSLFSKKKAGRDLMSSTSDHDQNRSLLVQKLEFDSIREETERDLKPRRRFSDLKPLKMFKQRSDRSLLNKRHSNAI